MIGMTFDNDCDDDDGDDDDGDDDDGDEMLETACPETKI